MILDDLFWMAWGLISYSLPTRNKFKIFTSAKAFNFVFFGLSPRQLTLFLFRSPTKLKAIRIDAVSGQVRMINETG